VVVTVPFPASVTIDETKRVDASALLHQIKGQTRRLASAALAAVEAWERRWEYDEGAPVPDSPYFRLAVGARSVTRWAKPQPWTAAQLAAVLVVLRRSVRGYRRRGSVPRFVVYGDQRGYVIHRIA
jgi:hypothetical protein